MEKRILEKLQFILGMLSISLELLGAILHQKTVIIVGAVICVIYCYLLMQLDYRDRREKYLARKYGRN